MRTHIYNKMTHKEVQAYLDRGGNTMFIAVGVVEVHGELPLDCETIAPEGFAVEMAEQYDGLAMINLPYFYPGATIVSNATVSFSIRDGIDYLMKIMHSLVDQGFRRLILLSGHGPAALTIDVACREFFEETKIHPCHINIGSIMPKEAGHGSLDKAVYGAYYKLHQMEYLAVDPNAEEIPWKWANFDPDKDIPYKFALQCQRLGGKAALYFENAEDHNGGRTFKSEEERLAACQEGLEYIHECVKNAELNKFLDALDEYQNFVWNVIVPKYPRINK